LIAIYVPGYIVKISTVSVSSQQIKLFCAQHLFDSAPSANITVIAGTALTGIFYYRDVGNALIIWITSMCIIACIRILISNYFFHDQKANFNRHPLEFWVKLYIASSLGCGLGWASLVFYIPATISPVSISIMYIIFFATMAGSITVLPVVLSAYIAYTTPIFLATFLFPFSITSRETLYLSLASIIYFTFIITTGRLLNKRYIQNFSLLIENE